MSREFDFGLISTGWLRVASPGRFDFRLKSTAGMNLATPGRFDFRPKTIAGMVLATPGWFDFSLISTAGKEMATRGWFHFSLISTTGHYISTEDFGTFGPHRHLHVLLVRLDGGGHARLVVKGVDARVTEWSSGSGRSRGQAKPPSSCRPCRRPPPHGYHARQGLAAHRAIITDYKFIFLLPEILPLILNLT
jgi:hypothetical protein